MDGVKIVVSEELLSDAKYVCKTVTLQNRPDEQGQDRVMSYSECGNIETGHPVLMHYGMMGSSLFVVFAHEQALKNNLRIICMDYPGIGDSTLVPGRTLESWAADVEQFCHQILPPQGNNHPSISILAHSMGGPHALAVWARMSDRVVNLTLVAPWVGEPETNPWWMRYFVQTLPLKLQHSYFPSLAATFLLGSSYMTYPLSYVVGSDKQLLLRAVQQVHAYNRFQGSVGNRELVRLAVEASSKEDFWDPLLAELTNLCAATKNTNHKKIRFFQGTSDTMVSLDACQKLVGWLKDTGCHVELTMMENADHDTILLGSETMGTILTSLQRAEGVK